MMLRTLSLVVTSCALIGCGGASTTTQTTTETTTTTARAGELSMDEVAAVIQDRSATIYDMTARVSYDRHHLPGATHLGEFGTEPVAEGQHPVFAFTAEQLPTDRNARIVFYGANSACWRGREGAERARSLGYTNVAVAGFGIEEWDRSGKPIEGTNATAPAAQPSASN